MLSFVHGYFDQHHYFPLLVFEGGLAEQPPVIRGELPGVEEAPTLGNFMHGRCVRGGGLQLLTDGIEPIRLEIGHRTQATDLLERIVQRPLTDGEFPT
jgi:hypothetical protein